MLRSQAERREQRSAAELRAAELRAAVWSECGAEWSECGAMHKRMRAHCTCTRFIDGMGMGMGMVGMGMGMVIGWSVIRVASEDACTDDANVCDGSA